MYIVASLMHTHFPTSDCITYSKAGRSITTSVLTITCTLSDDGADLTIIHYLEVLKLQSFEVIATENFICTVIM